VKEKPSFLIKHQDLEDDVLKKPVTKVPLPIISILEKSINEGGQTMHGPSLECNESESSYDDYLQIFNKLMRPRSNALCFGAA